MCNVSWNGQYITSGADVEYKYFHPWKRFINVVIKNAMTLFVQQMAT